ncbi:RHO GTPase-activating protein RGD1 [Golovinomyces cichoracearum]|uniref:RHO GTPase-activating protein RGD1 n=1 Tax=Golovinomyces cichoracearum TaxID=62708 RepID=A0A420IJ71_9PEZI|nr:RHO GTPase-activating protein RGD1 [Golovinomyces cichoracearum]
MIEGDTSEGIVPISKPREVTETEIEREASPDVLPLIETENPQELSDPNAKIVQDVINSEIGVATLLNRLKQSLASTKEFAIFLKKRSILEEEHSNGLRKLCRTTTECIKKPDHRHGSFLSAYEEVATIHEQMAENGAKFALSLHQMYDDLLEMATNIERGRKHWKNTGLSAEQRVADAEAAMRKSKFKYDALAEDYDKARTGDRQGSKLFGLKGPKSAAQYEEDILRKLYAADGDYATKVQAAQNQRADLRSKSRPDAVHALEELIRECDSSLTLQMQKFASFNEKLLLSNGLNVHPVKEFEMGNHTRSLRDAVHSINNDRDLSDYLISFANKVPPQASETTYQRNSILTRSALRQSDQAAHAPKQGNYHASSSTSSQHPPSVSQIFSKGYGASAPPQYERNFAETSSSLLQHNNTGAGPRASGAGSNLNYKLKSSSTSYGRLQANLSPQTQTVNNPQIFARIENLPPLKPVFGLSLEDLFERDGSAVPMVVCQCIQAVDLFGLEVEGIYRLSGTASQVSKIKSLFDNDAMMVDFRDPANFFHDVNSVAGLLKQFFRDLPDPLLTSEHYYSLIEAASENTQTYIKHKTTDKMAENEDNIIRRDSLHAIINSLPDPNYATLRALVLHLNRVQENSSTNRMNISNLAIVFGPTLMGANTESNIQNAGWQVKVVENILQNCYQIFDDD